MRVLHNAPFDLPYLDSPYNDVTDTMGKAYELGKPELGLKTLVREELGFQMMTYAQLMKMTEAVTGKKSKSFRDAYDAIPTVATRYAMDDAVGTILLNEELDRQLAEQPVIRRHYVELFQPMIPLLMEMEQAGILIDQGILSDVSKELQRRSKEYTATLATLIGEPVNTRSPKLVDQLVANGVNLVDETDTGRLSTIEQSLCKAVDVPTFERLAEIADRTKQQEIVYYVLADRECRTLDSTFAKGLLKRISPDGRLRGHFHQTQTLTNRLSSSDPNLQNIPRRSDLGKMIRRAFTVPPGYVWIKADWGQIEVRLFADIAKDPMLCAVYAKDAHADVHGIAAQMARDSTGLRVERDWVKNGVFETLYGGGVAKFAYLIGTTIEQAELIQKAITQTIPTLPQWAPYIKRELTETGYLRTVGGFTREFRTFWSPNSSESAEALRSAGDFVIQGSAADVLKYWLLILIEPVRQLGGKFIVTVHDEVGIEAPGASADSIIAEVHKATRLAQEHFGITVPLIVECAVGQNWADVK